MYYIDQTSKERSWPWKQSQLSSSCVWAAPLPKSVHYWSFNTSRASLPALPESCRFCLTTALGNILFPPSPCVLSISLMAPPGWWQHSSISSYWCLLLHTSCLAWPLSLWHVRTRTIPGEPILSHLYIFSYYLSHSFGALGLYTLNTKVPPDCWVSLCCYY